MECACGEARALAPCGAPDSPHPQRRPLGYGRPTTCILGGGCQSRQGSTSSATRLQHRQRRGPSQGTTFSRCMWECVDPMHESCLALRFSCYLRLWSQYGGLVSEDLCEFRRATRELLDEFTEHYKRQRIVDPSMQSTRNMKSLADCIYLDRLDRVVAESHGAIEMQSL